MVYNTETFLFMAITLKLLFNRKRQMKLCMGRSQPQLINKRWIILILYYMRYRDILTQLVSTYHMLQLNMSTFKVLLNKHTKLPIFSCMSMVPPSLYIKTLPNQFILKFCVIEIDTKVSSAYFNIALYSLRAQALLNGVIAPFQMTKCHNSPQQRLSFQNKLFNGLK